jgi:hypothetical protein
VQFGGSGAVNAEVLRTDAAPCDDHSYSLEVTVPPLGLCILKPC